MRADMTLMIEFWRQGRFPFDRLITEFPFSDIRTAWDKYREGSIVKPVLRMSTDVSVAPYTAETPA